MTDKRTATKQRVEIAPPPANAPDVASLAGTPVTGVHVSETVPGPVTLWDRAKAYWHTIFAALSFVAVLLVEYGPGLVDQTWLPEGDRHWITLAITAANLILTRFKSNEVWVPGPHVPPGTAV